MHPFNADPASHFLHLKGTFKWYYVRKEETIMTKDNLKYGAYIQILEEEQIPYKIHGVFKNHLPISKVESAPVVQKS